MPATTRSRPTARRPVLRACLAVVLVWATTALAVVITMVGMNLIHCHSDGWECLGWFILAALIAALVGQVAGAVLGLLLRMRWWFPIVVAGLGALTLGLGIVSRELIGVVFLAGLIGTPLLAAAYSMPRGFSWSTPQIDAGPPTADDPVEQLIREPEPPSKARLRSIAAVVALPCLGVAAALLVLALSL